MNGCKDSSRQIDRLVLGESLSPHAASGLVAHLRGCRRCAHAYNRAMAMSRRLHGRPQDPSADELRLLDLLAHSTGEPAPRALGLRHWLGGAALAVSVTLLAVVVLPTWSPKPPGDPGEVLPRGSAGPADVTLRAYCLTEQPGQVVAVSDETGRLACPVGNVLQFAYLLRGDQPVFLSIQGLDTAGTVLKYFPRQGNEAGGLRPSPREEPLPGSIRLNVKHQPGSVRVLAVVSRTTMPPDVLAPLLEHPELAGPPGAQLIRMTLDVLPVSP